MRGMFFTVSVDNSVYILVAPVLTTFNTRKNPLVPFFCPCVIFD